MVGGRPLTRPGGERGDGNAREQHEVPGQSGPSNGVGGLGLADGVTPGSQFMVQLASVAITVAWTLVVSVIILMIAKAVAGLRVDDQTEVDGLDLAEHGERGYPGN